MFESASQGLRLDKKDGRAGIARHKDIIHINEAVILTTFMR